MTSMVVLGIIGWVLLGVVLVLLLLLVIPIHLAFALCLGDEARFRVALRLGSGRAPPVFTLKVDGRGEGAPATKIAARDETKRTGAKRGRRRAGFTDRAWVRRAISEAPSAALETLRGIRLDGLSAKGWFGFDDPADTGRFWGVVAPIVYSAPGPFDLDIWPEFGRAGVGGEAEVRLHFVIIRLLTPGLRLIMRVAPWRH